MISVVVPVWNGERYLTEALDSVRAQTLQPHEIIVVDDGSSDASAEIARRYGRVISQPRGGSGAARNRGVDAAEGTFVAFLDADDVWEPLKLERQVAVMALQDAAFTLVSHFQAADVVGVVCPAHPMPGIYASTLLVRRDFLQQVGPLPADGRVGEFIEWYARAVDCGMRSVVLPDVLVRRRIHSSNQMRLRREEMGDYAWVLKSVLDRRRGKSQGRGDGV